MGPKYVEDPGEWFSFTLKDGVRPQCCGCWFTHDIYVKRKGRGFEMLIVHHERRRRLVAPARRLSSSPMRDC